jgi:hypothetical protein
MIERISALAPTALHPHKNLFVLISVIVWVNTRAMVRLEELDTLKKINGLIGNPIRNLSACSMAPQPYTLHRAPEILDFLCQVKWPR